MPVLKETKGEWQRKRVRPATNSPLDADGKAMTSLSPFVAC